MSAPMQKLVYLRFAMWFLLIAALLVLLLPLPVPLPVRIAVATVDLIAAAVVWLALRQRTRSP
jgi:hypothetical protein